MTDIDQVRYDLGFVDPLDESPVDLPDGWHGGEVVHTGGGFWCRQFLTFPYWREVTDDDPDVGCEILYNQHDGVTIGRYRKTDPDYRDGYGYDWDGEVETVPTDDDRDQTKWQAAVELMRKHGTPE